MFTKGSSWLLSLALLSLFGSGCSLQKLAVNQTAGILKQANASMQSERDLVFAKEALPASLKMIEGFLQAHQTQPLLLGLLAEGYMSYAFGFLEDEAEAIQNTDFRKAEALRERALAFHLRARDFGLRLLALEHAELAQALRDGRTPTAEELQEVGADDMAGLFWTANPWAAAINVGKHEPGLLAQFSIVRTLMERCDALDPAFFNAGPPLVLGAMDAGIPAALGGRPEFATKNFERAISLTHGKFLMARVLHARFVGVQTGNRAFFEEELTQVLEAEPDSVPGWELSNRLAQRRARRYLSEIDETFLDELEEIPDENTEESPDLNGKN